MRIGFDAKRFFHNHRGLGNYSRNILKGLTKYAPGNDYFLYDAQPNMDILEGGQFGDVKIVTPSKKPLSKSYWRTFQMAETYKLNNLDIFHGLSMEMPRDYKKAHVPVVVTVHDLIFIKHPEFYTLPDRLFHRSKLKYAVLHSNRILAISESTKQDILNVYPDAEDKIEIVYQSCNEVFYSKRTISELTELRTLLNLPEEYILCVGALVENKNIALVVEAMNIMGRDSTPPLVIVGKGEAYKKKLIHLANKYALADKLIFVSDTLEPSPLQLSGLYQMAKVFVFPSFYEGFGIPILEARFSGTPVIASNSTCLDEAGGGDTLYINPNDAEELAYAIEKTVSEPKTVSAPEEFTSERLTAKLIDLYTGVLKNT